MGWRLGDENIECKTIFSTPNLCFNLKITLAIKKGQAKCKYAFGM